MYSCRAFPGRASPFRSYSCPGTPVSWAYRIRKQRHSPDGQRHGTGHPAPPRHGNLPLGSENISSRHRPAFSFTYKNTSLFVNFLTMQNYSNKAKYTGTISFGSGSCSSLFTRSVSIRCPESCRYLQGPCQLGSLCLPSLYKFFISPHASY